MSLHCGTFEKPAEKAEAILNVLQVSIKSCSQIGQNIQCNTSKQALVPQK